MATDLYPEDPAPDEMEIEPEWSTVVNRAEGANEESSSLQEFAVYNARIKYKKDMVDKAQMINIYDHFMECKGRRVEFYLYWVNVVKTHYDQICGVSDGETTTYDIPGRSTGAHIVKSNGVVLPATDYSILIGGGKASSDRITFVVIPESGAVIIMTFSGYLRLKVKYADDNLSINGLFDKAFSFGIEFKGQRFID